MSKDSNLTDKNTRNSVADSEEHEKQQPSWQQPSWQQRYRINFIVGRLTSLNQLESFQKAVGPKISKEFAELTQEMVQNLNQNKANLTQQEEVLKAYLLKIDDWWETKKQDLDQFINKSFWQKLKEVISCALEVIKPSSSPNEEKLDNLQQALKKITNIDTISRGLEKIPDIQMTPDGRTRIVQRSFSDREKEKTNTSSLLI